MNEQQIIQYIADTFLGVDCVAASGDTFFIYDPDHQLPDNRRFPFATVVTGDRYDKASNLDRPNVYRLNIGVSKVTYQSLFGTQPPQAGADGIVETGHDFTALDQFMPHPVYAAQSWVCVLNPADEALQTVRMLLGEAYGRAVERYNKSQPDDPSLSGD